MKKFLLTTVIAGSLFFATNKADAQFRLNVNLHFGSPSWGLGANQAGNFYYMPEIDTYYDLSCQQFVYNNGGQWVYSSQLPYMYQGYDLNRGYKVMLNEQRPYLRDDFYRQRYSSYYNTYRPQVRMPERGRFDERFNGRFDNRNERFDRGRDNQRFDNRREERNDHVDRDDHGFGHGGNNGNGFGNGNGRWKQERGRG